MNDVSLLPVLAPTPITTLRFPRLLGVELRKMTDTRASRWTFASIAAIVVFILVWTLAQSDDAVSFAGYGDPVVKTIAFLVPVVAVLAMTAEWSQRTALTTFTLAPRRLPVLAAKYVGAITLSLAVLAGGLLLTAAATAIGGIPHDGASFDGAASFVQGAAVIVILNVTMGAAFGALAGLTPLALVAFYIAPTVWASGGTAVLGRRADWLHVFAAYDRLASTTDRFADLPQTVVSVSAWVLVPAVVGVLRALRREAK